MICLPTQRLFLIFCILCTVKFTLSWSFGKVYNQDVQMSVGGNEIELKLENIERSTSEANEKAREYIRSLSRAPTCAKKAAYGLILDCSKLSERSDQPPRLDFVKTAYASRLAVCELRDAGLPIPRQCEPRVMDSFDQAMFSVKTESEATIARCVKALETRPQSWTSYSNNRQNALFICQASRAEADRDEMLSLFSSLIKNNEHSQEALKSWHDFVEKQLEEKKSLAEELQMYMKSTSEELQGEKTKMSDAFSDVRGSLRSLHDHFVSSFSTSLQYTNGEAQIIGDTIQAAALEIAQFLSKLKSQGNDVSLQQQKDSEISASIALGLQESLRGLYEDQDMLRQQLKQMQSTVQLTSEQHGEATTELMRRSQTAVDNFKDLELSASHVAELFSTLSSYREVFSAVREWSGRGLTIAALVVFWSFLPYFVRGAIRIPLLLFITIFALKKGITALTCLQGDRRLLISSYLYPAFIPAGLSIVALIIGRCALHLVGRRLIHKDPDTVKEEISHYELIFHYYEPSTGNFVDDYGNIYGEALKGHQNFNQKTI